MGAFGWRSAYGAAIQDQLTDRLQPLRDDIQNTTEAQDREIRSNRSPSGKTGLVSERPLVAPCAKPPVYQSISNPPVFSHSHMEKEWLCFVITHPPRATRGAY